MGARQRHWLVMKTESLAKLRQIIEEEIPTARRQMIYKDQFAVGCYLHAQGHKEVGHKLCSEVLSELGYDRRKTYFNMVLDSLEGNELSYALDIGAHTEVNALVRDSAPDSD